jgi:hypothetical protein
LSNLTPDFCAFVIRDFCTGLWPWLLDNCREIG